MSSDKTDYCLFPAVVIRDTREQAGWSFRGITSDSKQGRRPLVVPIEDRALPSGDYSLAGYETRVAIERKSGADLFQSMCAERERFEREIVRLQGYDYAAVICEMDWPTMFESPPPRTKFTAKSVYRTVCSWQIKHKNVHWWMCHSRSFAERTCLRLLEKYLQYASAPKSMPNSIDT